MEEIDHKFHPFKVGERLSPDDRNKDHYARVYELQNDPDFLVKKIKPNLGAKGGPSDPKTFEQYRDIFEKDLSTVTKYLENFLPKYHLTYLAAVPKEKMDKLDNLPENSASKANAYMVMERVVKSDQEGESGRLDFAKQLDDFFEAAGHLFNDSFSNDKGVTVDLKLEHFIYGTTKTQKSPKLFFIDLHPRFNLSKKQFIGRITEITRPYMSIYSFPKTQDLIHSLQRS